MSFPATERIVFAENPLAEVICQLRFPSILTIAAEPPAAFQERVRESYPIYHLSNPTPNLPAELSRMLAELPVSIPVDAVTHRFANEDESAVISLGREFVAVTVANYETWGSFRAEVERAKAALEEVYRPAFYSRIGLRYRDIVDRERLALQSVEWTDLLNPALLGLLGADEMIRGGVRAVRGEALVELVEPPGAFVKLVHGMIDDTNGHQYAVDADWFTSERSSADVVLEVLDLLNRQAGDLFRWAVAPRLRDALGTRDDQQVA